MLMNFTVKSTFTKYFLFLTLLLIITGCTTSSSSKQSNHPSSLPNEKIVDLDLEAIIERGYITGIVDNSSTGMFIYRGNVMGYEYELLKAFSSSIGVELRIEVTPSLNEGFEKLNAGKGDILAYNLTVTKERKKRISFTNYHNLVCMVLVQRKPDDWRDMKLHEIENTLIRNPVGLIGKEVVVRNSSSYFDRLTNLSDEIGGDIIIIQDDPEIETETIIKKVADGVIDYTIAEEDVALVNSTYYRNLDVETAVSFPTQIAWGVRKTSTDLLDTLNSWINEMRKTPDYNTIYNKYFKSRKAALKRSRSEYNTMGGGKLSPYDSLIKVTADSLGWDWRLLAAQIFKESKFDAQAESWVGAVGLLQLMPTTAKEYGITNLEDPEKNLYAGLKHLKWLDNYFEETIPAEEEREKFILAAFNVGHGHVMDAMRLAEKYGEHDKNWPTIEQYLLKKSNSKYFNDPVVIFGYCRGAEPVAYVNDIYDTFLSYKALFPSDPIASESN